MIPLLAALLACADPAADPPADPAPVAVAAVPARAFVGEPLTLDAAGSVGDTATWTLSDGAVYQGWSVTLTPTAPGHLTVTLEIEATSGATALTTAPLSVVRRPLADPPRATSTVVAHADGRLFVAMPDHDLVAVVTGEAAVDWLPVCATPRRLSLWGDELAVACEGGAVERWDVASVPARASSTEVPGLPFAALHTADGGLWVTTRDRDGDAVLKLSPTGDITRVAVDRDPRALATTADGVLVTRWRSPADGGRLWHVVGDDWRAIPLPPHPGPDSDTGARGVPGYLQALAVRPDGRVAATGGVRANLDRGLARDGLPLTHETTVRADVRVVSLHPDEGPPDAPLRTLRLDNRDRVSALAWHPTGEWLYVAYGGGERVDVFDGWTFTLAASVGDVGAEPAGLLADGDLLWVDATHDRALVRVDLTDPSLPAVTARVDLQPPTGEPLDPDVLAGKVLFHRAVDPRMSRDGYVSCASCHLDGEDDGHTWDFTDRGEGLRNTLSLRGRAPGPIHWSANFDEVADFEADIRGPQQGAGFLADAAWTGPAGPSLGDGKAGLSADLDALTAYLDSLPPLLPPEDDAAGAALFAAAGCDGCHPAGGTDSAWLAPGEPNLHDVGTLTPASGQRLGGPLPGLDTPSLAGAWATPPYLHDGSALTLRAVLDAADGQHGDASALTDAQRDALARWLAGR
jgi:hypothetical protein